MKTRHLLAYGLVALLGATVAACSANIHDNPITVTIPNAMVNFTTDVDVNNVMPDETVPIAVMVQNVYLIDPAATPPPEHAADAGHLQIYLDDTSKPPLVITAQVNVDIKIPTETPAGPHKLICRFHKHDGTPTTTKFEVSITVKVTVGAADAGAPPADAGAVAPVDAAAAG